mmetsp:Transcript_22700/g.45954  ORF Transcript_22700/g.45954 Transcript_22700/m.45954 type:complete len:360 (-) Transcript_22700:176-1255(-)
MPQHGKENVARLRAAVVDGVLERVVEDDGMAVTPVAPRLARHGELHASGALERKVHDELPVGEAAVRHDPCAGVEAQDAHHGLVLLDLGVRPARIAGVAHELREGGDRGALRLVELIALRLVQPELRPLGSVPPSVNLPGHDEGRGREDPLEEPVGQQAVELGCDSAPGGLVAPGALQSPDQVEAAGVPPGHPAQAGMVRPRRLPRVHVVRGGLRVLVRELQRPLQALLVPATPVVQHGGRDRLVEVVLRRLLVRGEGVDGPLVDGALHRPLRSGGGVLVIARQHRVDVEEAAVELVEPPLPQAELGELRQGLRRLQEPLPRSLGDVAGPEELSLEAVVALGRRAPQVREALRHAGLRE